MNAAQCRVLIVDDHAVQRSILAHMFATLPVLETVEAGSGAEALQILTDTQDSFDLVVADLDMPDIDGMELARRIAARKAPPPVALISALDERILDSLNALSSFEPGTLLTVIPKPASLESLRRIVLLLRHQNELPACKRSQVCYSVAQITEGLAAGQFEAFFEPQISLRSGEVAGFEALARWRHPRDGIVAPGAFLSVIEAGPQMKQLTRSVLLDALEKFSDWQQQGFAGTISVNLSPYDLQDVTLSGYLVKTVQAFAIDPKLVKFELTESAATNSTAPAIENLTRLRMRGFNLSIDDFGTGYSSLQQLFRVPLTDLKIDKSFTTNMMNERILRAAIESILQLAQRLDLRTCGEGIETVDVASQLRWLGCDYGQGYLFTRPLAAEGVQPWMDDWIKRRGDLVDDWR
jgi:EAL domain-containing protein (putative c-di-GMP-specific phosphodiesterase class I)/ActR/RegA family two-component response regulator